jgi:zinc protease
MTDLQHAGVEDVKNFFRLYYAPNNATLAIVGDFDPAQAKAWVHKYFDDISKGAPITRPTVVMPTLASEKRMTFEDRVQIPRLYISWPTVGSDKEGDDDALSVLSDILAGARTARLTKSLVYDTQAANNVGALTRTDEKAGEFIVTVVPRPGHSLTELEGAVDAIIARVKADGPTAEEIERSRAGLEFGFISQLQSNLGKAEILEEGAAFHGDANYYKKNYEGLKNVTAADVKRVANKYLGAGRVVLSIVPLNKADQAAKADASTKVTVAPDGGHYILGGK